MLIMDMPNTPPAEPIIVQAQSAQPDTQKVYGTMGVCHLSPTAEQYSVLRDERGVYSLDVRGNADSIFFEGPHMPRLELDYENATVSVLQHPKHGTLSKDFSLGKDVSYYPNAGYVGNDKAVFLVNMVEGYKIKVVYFIKVNKLFNFDTNPDVGVYNRYCPKYNPWRISFDSPAAPGFADLASWQRNAVMSSVFSNASQSFIGFADLIDGAVGQTTGTTITLDTNAAGKMDMLSVLLHEYSMSLASATAPMAVT